jgi:lipopolysaccharide biosynthesis glycosyltransferase
LRDERLGAELRAFALRHADRLQWRDQDVLNEVLHSRRLPLHPRWNCMNSIMSFSFADRYFSETELDEARRAPAIRHFEGPASNKPWHLLCDPTSHAQYLRHRRQTPWPRMRRRGGSPPNLLRYARRRLK